MSNPFWTLMTILVGFSLAVMVVGAIPVYIAERWGGGTLLVVILVILAPFAYRLYRRLPTRKRGY